MSEERKNEIEEIEIEEEKKKKNIEVVTGNGEDLEISPVYNHIKMDKSNNNTDKKQQIVIPKKKKE